MKGHGVALRCIITCMKRITVKVTPRASRNEIIKMPDGSYKVKLTAAPVDGRANEQLIELLGDEWPISKSQIRIVKGKKGRQKIIEVVKIK